MFKTLVDAIKDVFSNKIRWLVAFSVATAIFTFFIIFWLFSILSNHFLTFENGLIEKIVSILGYAGLFIICILIFPSIVCFITGFFIDLGMEKLSKNRQLRQVPMGESLKMSGVVAVKGLFAGVVLIPTGLILSWIPLVNFVPVVLYYWINGRLFGREYFMTVAMRYQNYDDSQKLFDQKRQIWIKAGIIIAFLMTIPIVNMIAPMIAMTFMRRLYLQNCQENAE